MGLFSGIAKLVKNIVNGVAKVFKKVTKFVGKIAGSKWGKALLLAASVFTLGTAAMAGFQGFTQSAGGFLTKFVSGAKEFVGALANPIASAKEQLGIGATTGQAAQAAGVAEQASAAPGMLGEGAQAIQAATPMDTIAGSAGGLTGQAVHAGMQTAGVAAPAAQAAAQGGGILSKAAGAAWDFIKSPAGGTVLSSVAKGYAEGAQEEERMKEEERVRRYYDEQWRDPAKLGQLQTAVGGDVNVPGGYLDRARRVNEFLNNRDYSYPTAPGNPAEVAGYARSPGT